MKTKKESPLIIKPKGIYLYINQSRNLDFHITVIMFRNMETRENVYINALYSQGTEVPYFALKAGIDSIIDLFPPKTIIMDNGSNYRAKIVQDFKNHKIDIPAPSPLNPRVKACLERVMYHFSRVSNHRRTDRQRANELYKKPRQNYKIVVNNAGFPVDAIPFGGA